MCVTYLCGPPFVTLLPCTVSALEAMAVVLGITNYQTVFQAWAGQQNWCIRRGAIGSPSWSACPARVRMDPPSSREVWCCGAMAPTQLAQDLAP